MYVLILMIKILNYKLKKKSVTTPESIQFVVSGRKKDEKIDVSFKKNNEGLDIHFAGQLSLFSEVFQVTKKVLNKIQEIYNTGNVKVNIVFDKNDLT